MVVLASISAVVLVWGLISLLQSAASSESVGHATSGGGGHVPAAALAPAAASSVPTPKPSLTPDKRCPRTATACVDLAAHTAWLQHDGAFTYGPVPMNPGATNTPTPRGHFHVQWKDAHHISNEFNEPMPHSVFFAAGGIAFHQGSLTTLSHGCVHLSAKAATVFYNRLHNGDRVVVY